jgi:signal transduction histidine kinase
MDKIKHRKLRDNIKMKPSFFIYVFICLSLALALSVITVHVVDTFVSTVSVYYIDGNEDIDRINEDRDEDVYIAVEMIDEDFNEDNSDAILLYSRNWIVIALLILYFIFAILIAAQTFFKRKLDEPLRELEDAAQKISEKNLDFEIEYSGNDELGKLCNSFEMMRRQLVHNNIEMWNMIDEQKRVQHVLAHDIRTPLTVTKGYTDILLEYVPEGKISEEKILFTIECINRNIVRLENFVNTMSDMQNLDQLKIKNEETDIMALFESLRENAQIICRDKALVFDCKTDNDTAYTDSSVIEQIITNLISNAQRYAESKVILDCNYSDGRFIIKVTDDGKGFSEEALRYAFESYFTEENKN